jgi:RNA polymerase sigma-70 factor (ECF subfamily)
MDEGLGESVAEGLRQGDERAWSKLYETSAHRVWQQVSRLIGSNAEDVADVVQETFLAAARSAGKYRPSFGTPETWLWGIARRQVALHYRKQAQVRRLHEALGELASHNGGLGWLRSGSPAPEDALHSQDVAVLVRAALARLPAEYQGILASKYWDWASIESIAQEAGISQAAASSKLARARRAFRAIVLKLTRQMD